MKLNANHTTRCPSKFLRHRWGTGSTTMIRCAATVALLYLIAASWAEHHVIESIEWKTMESPLVVRGRIITRKEFAPETSYYNAALTIAIAEVLKGSVKETTLEIYPGRPPERTRINGWIESGREHLFFLRVATHHDGGREFAGKWVMPEWDNFAFDLEKPLGAYSAEMTILKSGNQIVDLVHRWAARSSREVDFGEPDSGRGTAGSITIDVPFGTPIWQKNGGGFSAVLMTVPAEEKHREMALKQIGSDDLWMRRQGAWVLGNLPENAAEVELLRKLLDDPGENRSPYSAYELAKITYPVRDAAWLALVYLGHKPETKPVSERKPTQEERDKYLEGHWKRSIAATLGKRWKVNSIEPCPAPPGWTRLQGRDGFVLTCLQEGGSPSASLSLYIMPKEWLSSDSLAWTAESAEGALDDLMRYVARSPSSEGPVSTSPPAVYLGVHSLSSQGAYHAFVLPTCPTEVKEKLVQEWELKIVKAPKK